MKLQLQLDRPLVVFDIESTGVNARQDRIIELAAIRVETDGTDVTIFASGIMVHEALQAAASLEQQGISAAVVDCYSIKPLDTDTVTAMAIKTGAAVVAENANRHGGLYSAVLEVLAENCPVPAACVAVEDEFGEVGSQSYLQQRFGLTAAHIEEQAKAVIARK